MDRSAGGQARFRKTVVAVVGFIPNAPTPRRDTVICELDCGHRRSVLSINRGEAAAPEQSKLIGAELECAKCALLEGIRHKARLRAVNRGRLGRSTAVAASRAAG